MPEGSNIGGLGYDGAALFHGGGGSGKVRAVRLPTAE